jgi:hypothetical protein
MKDDELKEVTKAFIELGSRSTMSEFRSVRTPATQVTGKSGVSFAQKAGRNTSLGDYGASLG